MTTLEINNKLFEYFAQKDTLVIDRDFKELFPIFGDKEGDKEELIAVLLSSLKEYENSKMINKILYKDKEYYILTKPLEMYNQNVEISPNLAKAISSIVNQCCDMFKNKSDLCDAKNIQEKDIKNILVLCQHLMTQNEQNS